MRAWLTVAVCLSAIPWISPAQGETLREALAKAYATNPTLAAQRQLVEEVEEEIPIARSGARPQVHSRVGLNEDLISSNATGRGVSASVELSLPFFDGGRVSNRVRSAKALHRAQVASLRNVEGDIITETVTAYMDVLLAREVATLQENQTIVLEETLTATRLVHKAGDLTLTDIAQAEARLALSRSDLAAAQSRLKSAEESYRRIVGNAPGPLKEPPLLKSLPATAEAAERIALDNSPELAATVEEARSAGFLVNAIQAERLPLLSAVAIGRYVNLLGNSDRQFGLGATENQSSGGVGVTANIPLSQGGSVSARVRQAKAKQRRWLEQLAAAERQVVARTRSAFAAYLAAQEEIRSNEAAVASNEVALEGSRVEFRVGTRILLDVLNAEQELLSSRVALRSAHRDAHVAAFSLLNAMGLATAQELDLQIETGTSSLASAEVSSTAPVTPNTSNPAPTERVAPTAHRPQIATSPLPTDQLRSAGTSYSTAAADRNEEERRIDGPVNQVQERAARDATDEETAAELDGASLSKMASSSREDSRANGVQKRTPAEPPRTGAFVVQLGSFRSAAEARAGWQRLRDALSLSAYSPLTTTIKLPRGTFYRLSIGGFDSRAEAVQMCGTIKTKGEPCFVRGSAGDALLDGS